MSKRLISVVGWHNAGKTTVIVGMIRALKRHGRRVATVKHTAEGFDLDREGTDTWRFADAGSDVVAVSGRTRAAVIERRDSDLPLEELLGRIPDDIEVVLVEGFKREPLPKIEVVRQGYGDERISPLEYLVAMVSDYPIDDRAGKPLYGFGEIDALVDWLVQEGRL